jgi:hypothetical protein
MEDLDLDIVWERSREQPDQSDLVLCGIERLVLVSIHRSSVSRKTIELMGFEGSAQWVTMKAGLLTTARLGLCFRGEVRLSCAARPSLARCSSV